MFCSFKRLNKTRLSFIPNRSNLIKSVSVSSRDGEGDLERVGERERERERGETEREIDLLGDGDNERERSGELDCCLRGDSIPSQQMSQTSFF
jgi:hypothetical protein